MSNVVCQCRSFSAVCMHGVNDVDVDLFVVVVPCVHVLCCIPPVPMQE